MPDVAVTLASLLAEATSRLSAAAVSAPAREALRIWADLEGGQPGRAFLDRAQPVSAEASNAYFQRVDRRADGEPLAYVTGWAGFRRLELRADPRALIPRPETEGLVERLLTRVPEGRVADVGTGSGCIGLSLASEGRYQRVLAIDCSADALALARVNRDLLGVAVELVEGDLTSGLATESLDGVISNPPYLTDAEYAALDPSVARWEPRSALASGADGLAATTRLLEDGKRVVRPGGWIALEVDAGRAQAVGQLARRLGWGDVAIELDLFGRERYLLARRNGTL
ncbi:MAG TPA: peptide chain release factor N(5)-glutamine methyltransferase [Gemmatimonadales bacterium]|jgi:release factor glutamine methyltransferase|nr:peptide chain release factor N(5)-glutamine methyltransferase [Gemmatimonadales bacterium]